MPYIDDEYRQKTITISRQEFGETVARAIYELHEHTGQDDELLTALLTAFSADVMHRLFGTAEEDTLEVEE